MRSLLINALIVGFLPALLKLTNHDLSATRMSESGHRGCQVHGITDIIFVATLFCCAWATRCITDRSQELLARD